MRHNQTKDMIRHVDNLAGVLFLGAMERRRKKLCAVVVLLFLALTTFSGCHLLGTVEIPQQDVKPELLRTFRWAAEPELAHNFPRKVVILNSETMQSVPEIPKQFAIQLAAELKTQRLFDVVVPSNFQCRTTIDEISSGRFDAREIVQIALQHNADAVLVFRVNDFKSYQPMKSNITVALLDAREAVLSFAADGVWDLSDPATFENFDRFLQYRSGGTNQSYLQMQKQSPASFSTYIAMQIAEAMSESCQFE